MRVRRARWVIVMSEPVMAAIQSASAFIVSQVGIISDDQLRTSMSAMAASISVQITQLAELSSDDATTLTDAISASEFGVDDKRAMASSVATRLSAATPRLTSGPKGQHCTNIKD